MTIFVSICRSTCFMRRKIGIVSILAAVAIVIATVIAVWMNFANIKIALMLKNNDIYGLNRYLYRAGDDATPMLYLIGEAMAGSNFNRRENANRAIDELLRDYSGQLENGTANGLVSLKLANLFLGSEYKTFNEAMREYSGSYSLDTSFQSVSEICGILADVAPLDVVLLSRDVEIPISYRRAGRGDMLCIDAEVNGKEQTYVFDTGAMKWNMTTEALAEEQGIDIICDSMHVSGIAGCGECKVGVLDRLVLGGIVIRHSVFVVIPDSMGVYELADGSIVRLGNVLGTDVMTRLREIRIDNARGMMVIPHEQTDTPNGMQNLMCQTGNYMLYLSVDGEVLKMNFDTGNVKTTLSGEYYRRHRSRIENSIPMTKEQRGGFGGVNEVNCYVLPSVAMKLNDCTCILDDVSVVVDEHMLQEDEYGALGVDFIRGCNTVIMNFERMFVSAD